MRVLVTGANGFIGAHLVRVLSTGGDEVVAQIRAGSDQRSLEEIANMQLLRKEFRDVTADDLRGCEALVHFAAINDTFVMDEKLLEKVNVQEPLALFTRAQQAGCQNIVYASSIHAYGNVASPLREDGPAAPVTGYGKSKLALDVRSMDLAEKIGTGKVSIIGLRYANVYGPGEHHKKNMASVVHQLALQMEESDPRIFYPGNQRRDFLYIDDAVGYVCHALRARESAIINAGSGESVSFNEVVGLLNQVLGKSRDPLYVDAPKGYLSDVVLDIAKAKKLLGFSPQYDIRIGIEKYNASGFLTAHH